MFVFCWLVFVVFCFVFLVLFVLVYELSHSLLFTQKLWSVSCLSGRALDLRLDLCLGAPSFFTSLKLGLPVS